MIDRRKFIQAGIAAGLASNLPFRHFISEAYGAVAMPGLSDPAMQPKFAYPVPDALSPGFKFMPDEKGLYKVSVAAKRDHYTGLLADNGRLLKTKIFGYGDGDTVTWPGKTLEVKSVSAGNRDDVTTVRWSNDLFNEQHILPVDTNLHWCYSLPGYEQFSIKKDGVPMIAHLHGGHTDFQFDGNPEFFYSPDAEIRGPQWNRVDAGFTQEFRYDNDVHAGNLWYHDHALGITRLNVYAGLAGFYFIRDEYDTGEVDNPLGLPAWPYEKAYAIQDRMFTEMGDLFYSAYPGEPFYDDFIAGEGAILPPDLFPGGGPTALAEFFGDHMLVNGVIWPYEAVEPRNYRMRLLNGTDSRFMVIQFRIAASSTSTDLANASAPIGFHVIGSDQGLAESATYVDTLVFEPGSRYDIVVDFSTVPAGSRVIMANIAGDAPFGGDYGDALDPDDLFPDRQTDRVMAFDVVKPLDGTVLDTFNPTAIERNLANNNSVDRTRKVALFEGMDEFGRLQPLLGTAEPTVDATGNIVNGAIPWHMPTTENPGLYDTEVWEIYNATEDAHPVHLHLVNFQVLGRQEFSADVVEQPTTQHNGAVGTGFRLENIVPGAAVNAGAEYVENAPKDMVTALPGQVTRIKATFDKPGRYVWHCHILSHEDHEMMRVLHVGPGA